MRKELVFLILFIMVPVCVKAIQDKSPLITGVIRENSGNTLSGASVSVEGSFLGTISDHEGKYKLEGLMNGIYRVRYSFIGYESQVIEIIVNGLTIRDVVLEAQPLMAGEVIINAMRAGNRTPLAYTTIDRELIRKQNSGQDIPFLLGMTPSLVETSEAGNGIGYTSLRIRGTDASRINVTIDGIPLNDPESQQVFWVDLPDLASSVDNIQVQRGAGSSSNGAGAFGATVSIQTMSAENEPSVRISSSAGSFNTFKNSVSAATGLLAERFALNVRLSQLKSDGYIRRTGSDHKSAYLSGVVNAGRSRIKANVILGQEHTGIGWWGVPKEMLAIDRRYNPAGEYTDENGNTFYYKNESDNYRQDHYQLIYSLRINESLNFSSALHYTAGKGYYEEFREDQPLQEYGLPEVHIGDTVISETDMIRRKWMSNDFYGLVFSLRYLKGRLEMTAGGGINNYSGDHFGTLVWMKYPGAVVKDHRWYLNNGTKSEGSLYAKANYEISSKLSFYGDLQYRYILYKISGNDDDLKDLSQTHDFGFFNPKAGIFWAISPHQDGWLSFSVAGREPTRSDFKEAAGDPDATPRQERLFDTEAGYRLHRDKYLLGINGYLMYYHNQLVPTGELSSTGYSIMTNVGRSYRMGLEWTGSWKPLTFFNWDMNLTVSRNKINGFTEHYTDYNTSTWESSYKSKQLGTVDIAYSPAVTGSSALNFSIKRNLGIHFISKYTGRQYFDNTMSRERMLDPYFVNNLRISYEPVIRKFNGLEFNLHINNIFNTSYESNAYGGNWYEDGIEKSWSYYFPQAGTNIMVTAGIAF